MSDEHRPEPTPDERKRIRRERWIGAGMFLLIAPVLIFAAIAVGTIAPAGGTLVAILGAAAAVYYLDRRSRDMLLGCLLAFAVALVVAGGTCIVIIVELNRMY